MNKKELFNVSKSPTTWYPPVTKEDCFNKLEEYQVSLRKKKKDKFIHNRRMKLLATPVDIDLSQEGGSVNPDDTFILYSGDY